MPERKKIFSATIGRTVEKKYFFYPWLEWVKNCHIQCVKFLMYHADA